MKKPNWAICQYCRGEDEKGIGCDFCDGGAVIRTEKE